MVSPALNCNLLQLWHCLCVLRYLVLYKRKKYGQYQGILGAIEDTLSSSFIHISGPVALEHDEWKVAGIPNYTSQLSLVRFRVVQPLPQHLATIVLSEAISPPTTH